MFDTLLFKNIIKVNKKSISLDNHKNSNRLITINCPKNGDPHHGFLKDLFELSQMGLIPILSGEDNLEDSRIKLKFNHIDKLVSLNNFPDDKTNEVKTSEDFNDQNILHIRPDPSLIFNDTFPKIAFFTSGSTGKPKIIIHALKSLFDAAYMSGELLNLKDSDKVLSPLPLHHMGGFLTLLRPLIFGHELKICSSKKFLDLYQSYDPNIVISVPYHLIKTLNLPLRHDMTFYLGGGPLTPSLWAEALQKGMRIFMTYGLTESCGAIMYQHSPYEPGATPFSDTAIYIDKESTLLSFHNKRQALAVANESGVWQRHPQDKPIDTLDMASSDSGQFKILGRKDQMIISGGENISPTEIEDSILKKITCKNIKVMGLPHDSLGEMTVLFLEPYQNEGSIDWTEVLKDINPLKRPKVIYSYPEFTGIKARKEDFIKLSRNSKPLYGHE